MHYRACPVATRSVVSEPAATDLNELLLSRPAATLLLRVAGDSMVGAGIRSGDLLVVDRQLRPRSGHVVVALLDGAFTLKRLVRRRGGWWLEAAHPAYPPLPLEAAADGRIWGVAVHAIRCLCPVSPWPPPPF